MKKPVIVVSDDQNTVTVNEIVGTFLEGSSSSCDGCCFAGAAYNWCANMPCIPPARRDMKNGIFTIQTPAV